MNSAKRQIVVTGLGIVSPLGCGSEQVWSRLISGFSGVDKLPEDLVDQVDTKIGARVPSIESDPHGFDLNKILSIKDQRKMDRFIHFALEASDQAVQQANWYPETDEEKERTATIIGSSIGGFTSTAQAIRTYDNFGSKRISPFTIPSFLINLAAGQISIRHGFKGPMKVPANACAASTQAIGDGMQMILSGEADIAICGGAEACIDPVILASFVSARAVSTRFNDRPKEASRPFDIDRDGFVLGEGAAVMVIESLEHALRRGAQPLAEIIGYGSTSDAYHVTCSHQQGDALKRAMQAAIKMSKVEKSQIGYLNAHGTSTPAGDKSELMAIRDVFDDLSNISISSTKSATGHLLGAAGSLEAIFTVLALKEGLLPPTLNLCTVDAEAQGMDIVGDEPKAKQIEYAMTNSAGFGGINASLVFKRWSSPTAQVQC